MGMRKKIDPSTLVTIPFDKLVLAHREIGVHRGRRHGFRDVLRAIFAVDPNATILTAMARYDGSDGFESTYPDTYHTNAGSLIQPVAYGDLCDHYKRGE